MPENPDLTQAVDNALATVVDFSRVVAADIGIIRETMRAHLLRQPASLFTWLDQGARMTIVPGSHEHPSTVKLHYIIRESNKNDTIQLDGFFLHPEKGWSIRALPSGLLDASDIDD